MDPNLSEYLNSGNVSFMVITTVLVFIMTPGLAFFYGGLVDKKNTLSMMYYSFIAIGVVTVLWTLGGFSLVFGPDAGGVIGIPTKYFMLIGIDYRTYFGDNGIPFLMFFMYQLMFAIITAPLMTGAIASRITIVGWIKVLVLWNILVYFPVAHWIWGGGFLSKFGMVDWAGGTVIHVTAGFSALIGVFYFGRRVSIPNKGYGNMNLVLVGAAILLFGWFGFNSGGALASNQRAAIAFTNTGIAAGFATIVWVILAYAREKKLSFVEMVTGSVAGLATITPCAGYINPQAAAAVGVIAAIFCFACITFAKKMKWDDALGVWGVHGMGGFIGTILVGLFAVEEVGGISGGGRQFYIQILGVLLVAAYTSIMCWLIFKICNATGSIKVPDEIQEKGLDKAYLAENELDNN